MSERVARATRRPVPFLTPPIALCRPMALCYLPTTLCYPIGMSILSIQSAVSYGYVGNSVAVPALQRLGCEVWRIDTVALSNHPGHGAHQGSARPPAELSALLDGMQRLDLLADCQAVVSGYLGAAGTAEVIVDAVASVRSATSGPLYICDPVIGDDGRVFVEPDTAAAIRDRLVPMADILTPNLFELGWLTGRPEDQPGEIIDAARDLVERGPTSVIVTGVRQGDMIGAVLVDADGASAAMAPRCDRSFNGTGDLFTALIAGWLVKSKSRLEALALAVAGLDVVTRATERAGRRELDLIGALPAIVDPDMERVSLRSYRA